jgi:hypothetical protein
MDGVHEHGNKLLSFVISGTIYWPVIYESFTHPYRRLPLFPSLWRHIVWYTEISEDFTTSIFTFEELDNKEGRSIAQAVSRWLPIATSRVRIQVRLCGICGGQSGTGAGFLRVLRFPLPILIPSIAPHSSSIVLDWYNRPISGQRPKWTLVPLHSKKLKKTY